VYDDNDPVVRQGNVSSAETPFADEDRDPRPRLSTQWSLITLVKRTSDPVPPAPPQHGRAPRSLSM